MSINICICKQKRGDENARRENEGLLAGTKLQIMNLQDTKLLILNLNAKNRSCWIRCWIKSGAKEL